MIQRSAKCSAPWGAAPRGKHKSYGYERQLQTGTGSPGPPPREAADQLQATAYVNDHITYAGEAHGQYAAALGGRAREQTMSVTHHKDGSTIPEGHPWAHGKIVFGPKAKPASTAGSPQPEMPTPAADKPQKQPT